MVLYPDVTWACVCFVVMGQLGELCSSAVSSGGPSGESQGCSTHHHRLGEGHDLVLPPGLEQGQCSGCLSWSVSPLRCSAAEMHTPVPPKPDASSFSELFLSFCHTFWIASHSDHELALMELLPCGMQALHALALNRAEEYPVPWSSAPALTSQVPLLSL